MLITAWRRISTIKKLDSAVITILPSSSLLLLYRGLGTREGTPGFPEWEPDWPWMGVDFGPRVCGEGVWREGWELPFIGGAESQRILFTPQGEDALATSFLEVWNLRLKELVGLAQCHVGRNK